MIRLAAIIALVATQAPAANCDARQAVIARLQTSYGEALKVGGLQEVRARQHIMEIWASDETGNLHRLADRSERLKLHRGGRDRLLQSGAEG